MTLYPKARQLPSVARVVSEQGTFGGETADSLHIFEWTDVAWTNNWTTYDTAGTWGTVQYTKDRSGFVHLRGLGKNISATSPVTAAPLFTLPQGYWPEFYVLGLGTCSWGLWEWQMTKTGQLQWRIPRLGSYSTPNWFNFGGISWHAPPQ